MSLRSTLSARGRSSAMALVATGIGLAIVPISGGMSLIGQRGHGAGLLLFSALYFLGLGLGAMYVLALFTVTRSRLDVICQESLSRLTFATIPGAVLLFPVLILLGDLYPWIAENSAGLQGRWLTEPAFVARSVLYIGAWLLLGQLMRKQPESVVVSASFLLVGTITVMLAATDWLMSLTPEWTSTVFGLHILAGFVSSSIAAALTGAIMSMPPYHGGSSRNHGQFAGFAALLFVANCIWMYLWYCQYLVIWYTNQPHEIGYYLVWTSGGRAWPLAATVALHWFLPFTLLLSRAGKCRSYPILVASISTLAGHCFDLFTVIAPAIDPAFRFSAAVLAALLGGGVAFYAWRKRGATAENAWLIQKTSKAARKNRSAE